MIEEPYRWVDAIANRREYIETQLATGSAVVAISFASGILLATSGGPRQKIFEIYDRIALGAIGHPGDIERLRMAAIDVASSEGFTRSAADVSLRRLAHYSLSPVLKTAFEQVYGAPYLARLLFAEIGATAEQDLFLRLDFDGTIASAVAAHFAVLAPTQEIGAKMEAHLQERSAVVAELRDAVRIAAAVLQSSGSDENATQPNELEAAVLERTSAHPVRYRTLSAADLA